MIQLEGMEGGAAGEPETYQRERRLLLGSLPTNELLDYMMTT